MKTFWVNNFAHGCSLTRIDDASSEQDALRKALIRYPCFDDGFFQGQTRMLKNNELPFVTTEIPLIEPCEEPLCPTIKYGSYKKSGEGNAFIVRQDVIFLESMEVQAACTSEAITAARIKLERDLQSIGATLDYYGTIIYAGPLYVTQPSVISPIDNHAFGIDQDECTGTT